MKFISSVALVFALISTSAAAAEALSVRATAPYAKDIVVPSAVKAECGLETKLPAFVQD